MKLYHYTPEQNKESIITNGLCASYNCADTLIVNNCVRVISEKAYVIRQNALFFFNIEEEDIQTGILEVSVEYSNLVKSKLYVANLELAEWIYNLAKGNVHNGLLRSYTQKYIQSFKKVRKIDDLWSYTSTEILYNNDIPTKDLIIS